MFLKWLFASYKRPYIKGNELERVRVKLQGCELQLTLPEHFTPSGFDQKMPPRDIANIYDQNAYEYEHPDDGPIPFSQAVFIRRYWCYYGPFWKGHYMARTDFMATVMRVNTLPEGMSCLNPYHLEQAVMRLLYWPLEAPRFNQNISPVNWRVEYKQGNPWVIYEVHSQFDQNSDDESHSGSFESAAITALDDRHIIRLHFSNLGCLPFKEASAACNAMRDKVINSIQWTLSSSLQAHKEEVLQQFTNTHINLHRDPEPWIFSEWREGDSAKGEPRRVLTKLGTPEPVFKP